MRRVPHVPVAMNSMPQIHTAAPSIASQNEDAVCRSLAARAAGSLATISGRSGCDRLVGKP